MFLHCARNMHMGLMMCWGMGPGNRVSPPASATAASAQGGWSDHTEPQTCNFWYSLRADPQLPTHSCLLCSGYIFFSHTAEAHGSPINFAGAVAEEFIQFSQSKYHFAPDLACFYDSSSLHTGLEEPCHFIFSLGSSLGFKHIQT